MKKMGFAAIAAGVLISAIGCGSGNDPQAERQSLTESKCETAIRDQMKDPKGVEFRNSTGYWYGSDSYYTSGEYNAPNSYGAMVGFKPYYCKGFKPSVPNQGDWTVLDYPNELVPTKQSLCDLYRSDECSS